MIEDAEADGRLKPGGTILKELLKHRNTVWFWNGFACWQQLCRTKRLNVFFVISDKQSKKKNQIFFVQLVQKVIVWSNR